MGSSDNDLDFEDLISEPVLSEFTQGSYNPEKYVQVRVLCGKDLPVFKSGQVLP